MIRSKTTGKEYTAFLTVINTSTHSTSSY